MKPSQFPLTKAIYTGVVQIKNVGFALKQKLLFSCLAIIFVFTVNAQTGIDCNNAQNIIIGNRATPLFNPNPKIQTQTSNANYWYSFTTNESSKTIKLVNQGRTTAATSFKVYSGTCNRLA